MTRNVTIYCLVAAVTVCLLAGGALADLLAYEGFNYGSETKLCGKDGGIGFAGAWTSATNFHEMTGDGQSLTMPNLHFTPEGSHLLGTIYIYDIYNRADRALATTLDWGQDGEFYMSALYQRPGQAKAQSSIRLLDDQGGTMLRIGLGGNNKVLLGGSSVEWTDVEFAPGDTYFLVARVVTSQSGNDSIQLKAYGINDVIDLEAPGAWDKVMSVNMNGVASKLRVELAKENMAAMDEIRIGTTWESVVVPEPGAMSLLALGGAVIVKRRKK